MNGSMMVALLEDLLDSTVAALGATAPSRQFVAHGTPAIDCESVFVQVTDLRMSKFPGLECAANDIVSLSTSVVRCFVASTGDTPIPAASGIDADSLTLAFDLGQLLGGLSDRWGAGTLFPSVPTVACGDVEFLGAEPLGPEGGFGGWKLNMTVSP